MGEHKILITGGSGKFATAFRKEYGCDTPPKQELDVTNYIQLKDYIKHHTDIQIIIHAGAITSVTKCEMEKDLAYNVNVNGTRNIIRAIQENDKYPDSGSRRKIKLIYMSTPCVFDGKIGNYDEDSLPNPENYYGLTKYISEELIKSSGLKHLIVRANYVPKEKWAYEKAFTDRYGTYLFTEQVVSQMTYILNNSEGIVHIVGSKKMSMYELAKITTPKIKKLTQKEFYGKMAVMSVIGMGNKDKKKLLAQAKLLIPKLTVDMTMVTKRGYPISIDRS